MTHHLYCIKLLGIIVYIGVTKDVTVRLKAHRFHKKPVGRILRKYGERAWMETLAIGQREYIYSLEVKAIKAFGTRHPNGFNLNAGGRGCRDPLPSTRAKLSAIHMGNQYNTGRTASKETRARMSTTHIRRGTGKNNLGKVRSSEDRAKLSTVRMGNQNAAGFVHSAETRAKVSAAGKGRVRSAETRARMSTASYAREATRKALRESRAESREI